MLQYLIILLDNTSTSYCHYDSSKRERHLISIEDLKKGIFFGMKENLMIQFVYPNYELPQEYNEIIETIDHYKIMPSDVDTKDADIVVFNHWTDVVGYPLEKTKTYILKINRTDIFSQRSVITPILGKTARLNIVINDINKFTYNDFESYKECLKEWAKKLKELFSTGCSPQLNILTDRMMLDKMNNCGAGDTSITLAPDGKFYICPALYFDEICDGTETSLGEECSKGYNVGSLEAKLDIKNPQLYKLNHAPLCRNCDAYHCKRCIWLNRRTTLEVNTPSHEQCVMAHIERNASRQLLADIRTLGTFLPEQEIKEIDYLDPFDVREKW